jgi:hypothetical protein
MCLSLPATTRFRGKTANLALEGSGHSTSILRPARSRKCSGGAIAGCAELRRQDKPPPDFSSGGCRELATAYFLQQAAFGLQHLPPQQESAEREVFASAELSNVVAARIINRYFISSPVEFDLFLAHAERARPLNENETRRRNRRLLGPDNVASRCCCQKLASRWREKKRRGRAQKQRQAKRASRTTLSILVWFRRVTTAIVLAAVHLHVCTTFRLG